MEVQLNVEIPTELKKRMDIHRVFENKSQKEIVIEALDKYIPKYFVKLQE
jgi:hypothetical protein